MSIEKKKCASDSHKLTFEQKSKIYTVSIGYLLPLVVDSVHTAANQSFSKSNPFNPINIFAEAEINSSSNNYLSDILDSFSKKQESTSTGMRAAEFESFSERTEATLESSSINKANNRVVINSIEYTSNNSHAETSLEAESIESSEAESSRNNSPSNNNNLLEEQGPDAANDNVTLEEDGSITINVLSNDSHPNNQAITIIPSSITEPEHGSITLNPDGTLTYTPDPNYHGEDSFTYDIVDPQGNVDTATVYLEVTSVNDLPIAENDTATTDEDTSININSLANDGDPADPTDIISIDNIVSGPSNGSVNINSDGTFTYTPDAHYNGNDSFVYQITDGNGGTDTATVNITINPINDNPEAQDDNISTDEDTPINISLLDNDSDLDGDTIVLDSILSGPTNGTLSVNPDGTVDYTPDANYHGPDSFTYQISDGNGGFDTATVNITVNPVDDAVIANNDTAITDEDTPVSINAIPNDSDLGDGDTLSIDSIVSSPSNGSVTINPDGTITYTPDDNYHGNDSFVYQITDGNGNYDTAVISITVNPINDDPEAQDDNVSTDEDTPINITNLLNDSDVDGDTITLDSILSGPSNGTLSINPDGTIDYTPDTNYHGPDSFTYQISDGNGGFDTATVNIIVNSINDNPIAQDDNVSTDEDTPINITVQGNDSDPIEGSPLTTSSIISGPDNGSITINPDGTITYTPDDNYHGTDSFVYEITDADGGTDTATVNIIVNSINDNPIAQDDNVSTDEDTPINITNLLNDSDVDGDTITLDSILSGPSNGTLSINPDGTVDYTPDANYHGPDSFTYQISDGNGGFDTATVNITVNSINDNPIAQDDNVSTDEDTSINITNLLNDSDVDGDTITLDSILSGPSNGTLSINPDGTIDYTPDANYHGPDSFTYQISDGNGGFDTATVNITVNSINDNPIAQDDNVSTDEDTPINITVQGNDSDPIEGSPLTTSSIISGPDNGSVTINPDGTITYTPDTNYHGADSFVYEITDADGGTDTATVNIIVNSINDNPIAQDDNVSTDEDTPINITVQGNDSDPIEGSPLTTSSIISGPDNGSLTINPDNTITYTPDANYNGPDSFVYEITDADGGTDTATVNIIVNPVDDAPVPVTDNFNIDEDNVLTFTTTDILGNDIEYDGEVISFVNHDGSTISNGTLGFDGTTFTYTPDLHYYGSESFTYVIQDASGNLETGTVNITINSVNDLPIAGDDSGVLDEDTSLTIDVQANDDDPVEQTNLSTTSIASGPNNGSVTINPDGTITYTPNAHYNGTDSFTYEITDADGGTDTATVDLVINPVEDNPYPSNDVIRGDEDTIITFTVDDIMSNDGEVDGDSISFISYDGSTIQNGTLTFVPGATPLLGGTFIYVPDLHWNGNENFTYTVQDENGNTNTANVRIRVRPVNDMPVAVDDSYTVDEDVPTALTVLSNDFDPIEGHALDVNSIISQPANGTVSINSDGTITYTSDLHFNGIDSFEYELIDSEGGTDTALVTLTINPVDDPPTAVDDTASLDEDSGSVNIDILDNDFDVEGDPFIFDSIISNPSNGTITINLDGTIDYTPDPDFFGVDTFEYQICGSGGCTTATVSITVNPINDAPEPVDDAVTTQEDTAVKFVVLPNDIAIDKDLDTLTVDAFTQPSNGTVTYDAGNGKFTYIPDPDFTGTDTFTYDALDPGGLSGTATVTVTVTPVNDSPVSIDDTATVDEDNDINIDVVSNDSDVDGDSLIVTNVTSAANGTVTINPDGTINYTPDPNFNGVDSFTYQTSDGNGGMGAATVNITVNPINDIPVAIDNSQTIYEDQSVTLNLVANDEDIDLPEGDTLTVNSITTSPANGSVVINANGTVTYTPDPDYNGSDSFEYEVVDSAGATDTATVSITILPAEDLPEALSDNSASTGADSYTINEDTSTIFNVLDNDIDVDGDTLTITNTSFPDHGNVTVNADGTILYTPNAHYNGTDSFTYEITDGNGNRSTATVDIIINPIEDNPIAEDDPFSYISNRAVTTIDTSITINDLFNDREVDSDSINFSQIITHTSNGTLTENPDGTVTYTPNAGYLGEDSFTYELADEHGNIDTATGTIVVVPELPDTGDGATLTTPDNISTDEDTPITFDPLSNDSGSSLTVAEVSHPDNIVGGEAIINPDGTVTFIPEPNWYGTTSFQYAAVAGSGHFYVETVNVEVFPVDDPVVANDDSTFTDEDTSVTINVIGSDARLSSTDVNVDPTDTLSVSAITGSPANGSATINSDGTIDYTPDLNFYGTDTFTYELTDGNGNFDTATVTVEIDPKQDAPVANNDTASVDEDSQISISPLDNDIDVDGDQLVITNITEPTNGLATVNPDGTISYTPNENYHGSDSFSYTIIDSAGNSSTATVDITVNSVNDDPESLPESATTIEDNSIIIDVLSNDSDLDGDSLSVSSITVSPANGSVTINPDGTLTYTPDADFYGSDTFTYEISDGNGGNATGEASVFVSAENDAPVTTADTASVDEDSTTGININVLDNDIDVDGDTITVSDITQPDNGRITLNADGSITYIPNPDFVGVDTFTYEISDAQGGVATGTAEVTVNNANQDPITMVDDTASTTLDTPVTIDVTANDIEPDGETLTVIGITTNPGNGSVVINPDNTITYTPDTGFTGTDSFVYQVDDGNGNLETATVNITVV